MFLQFGSRRSQAALTALLGFLLTSAATGQSDAPPGSSDDVLEELADLDLEALLEVKVTSVAGREQTLFDTPAAMYVITGEDVRRTGHRSLAEALRLAPGFTVGQISPSVWAIGSRGLTDRFSNDLLVMIDGRTVYDPLFSGVFWNVQDVMLEDLDRIEVIRGPGATLWGANAVNGVVNVTTKSAADTQGLLITGGGGNAHQGFGAVRFGGEIDADTHFRVSAKYDNYDHMPLEGGGHSPSDWDMFRGAFRLDHDPGDGTTFTMQADAYGTGHISSGVRVPTVGHFTSETRTLDERFQGGNFLMRLGRVMSDDEGWSVQTYYDRTETRAGIPGFEVRRDTFDVDYRQYTPFGDDDEHVLMWGLGYRHSRDRTEGGPTLAFDPRNRSLDTFSGFIQDTITLEPRELFLMLGSKFEHNDFTGFEYQPSARLSWTPDDDQTWWGAVSRAVRTPSRIADDAILTTAYADPGLLPGGGGPTGSFVPLQLTGNPDVESEELIAFELGYRRRITPELSIDVAAFYNKYDELITFSLPVGTFDNRGEADTYGFEVVGNWAIADNWRVETAYSFLRIDFDSPDGNAEERESPQQQVNVTSYIDLTEELELNSALYYVDNIPDEAAEAYVRLDIGLTWRPADNVEIAVWGQNLLDPQHFEFGDDLFLDGRLEVERSIYGQVTFRF